MANQRPSWMSAGIMRMGFPVFCWWAGIHTVWYILNKTLSVQADQTWACLQAAGHRWSDNSKSDFAIWVLKTYDI